MKLARYSTGRWQFIAFQSAFHGRTMGALSLTSSKPVQRKGFGPLVPGVTHAPFGNAAYIEDVLFKTTVNPSEVAAIVVEPIQGEGGYIIPPPEFLPGLEKLARKRLGYVQTRWFGVHPHPDDSGRARAARLARPTVIRS